MNFHFFYFKTFFGGPTGTFYPHKVLFLTIVSFSGFGQTEMTGSQNSAVLRSGASDVTRR